MCGTLSPTTVELLTRSQMQRDNPEREQNPASEPRELECARQATAGEQRRPKEIQRLRTATHGSGRRRRMRLGTPPRRRAQTTAIDSPGRRKSPYLRPPPCHTLRSTCPIRNRAVHGAVRGCLAVAHANRFNSRWSSRRTPAWSFRPVAPCTSAKTRRARSRTRRVRE